MPETAKEIENLLAKAKASDDAVAAQSAGATYAGDADPYKKPHEAPADEADTE
mgnify:FL=1